MNDKRRRLSLDAMEEIARVATRAALRGYKPIQHPDERLTLGSSMDDEHGSFELYLAGERPEDAVVLTTARVDRLTGEVHVEVFLEPE